MPLDNQQMLTAPVFVDNYALLGAASVTLPGAFIGHHATVSPLAVIDAGADIKPKAICMGAPAKVVKVRLLTPGHCSSLPDHFTPFADMLFTTNRLDARTA